MLSNFTKTPISSWLTKATNNAKCTKTSSTSTTPTNNENEMTQYTPIQTQIYRSF
jgi:hypothetical protein